MDYISVIEISPTFVEMIICQRTGETYEIIERVREEVNFFKGYQKTGKISFERSQRLCEILKKMKELSMNYGIEDIQTITTSSFNQLENAPFLLDQINIHTGLLVEMPKLLQKKKMLFKKFMKYKGELTGDKKNTVILNVGTNTTDLVFLHNRKLIKNQMISTGGYKIGEFAGEVGLTPDETKEFIGDYIYNYLIESKRELGRKKISKLVLIGDVKDILKTDYDTDSPVLNIKNEDIQKIVSGAEKMSYKGLSKFYNISEQSARKAFAELCMLEIISKEFGIKNIAVLSYDNKELLVYEKFYPEKKKKIEESMWELSLQAARFLGEKYHFNLEHSELTLELSRELFKALEKKHNLPYRALKYLEIANYLHDTGKYINFAEHNRHSEYITKNSFIFGLSEREVEYVSILCYAHSGNRVDFSSYLADKTAGERILLLKALAILKMSVALDRSKRQKIEKYSISVVDEKLSIEIDTREKFLIERIFFDKQINFFREVFGMTPELRINRRYYGEEV